MGASSSHPVFVIYKAIVSFFGLNLNIKAKRVKAAELILMAINVRVRRFSHLLW